jgi:hypothetical protein
MGIADKFLKTAFNVGLNASQIAISKILSAPSSPSRDPFWRPYNKRMVAAGQFKFSGHPRFHSRHKRRSSGSTNMPGMKGYDPSKGSFRAGRGRSVVIPKGGRIF